MASWLARVLSRPQRGTSTIYSTFWRQAYWTPPSAPTPPPPPPPQPAPPRWWKTKLLLCLVGVWLQLGAGAHYGEIHAEWLAGFIAESWVSMEIVKERPERFGGPPLSYWTAIRDRKEILDRELHERGYIRQANELYERLCGPHVNNSLPVEEASEDHERIINHLMKCGGILQQHVSKSNLLKMARWHMAVVHHQEGSMKLRPKSGVTKPVFV